MSYCCFSPQTLVSQSVSQSVQSLSHVRLWDPWIAAHQASLPITNSRSLLKLMSIELVMPSSHLILCRPLLLLPPIPPSIRVFSNESALHVRFLEGPKWYATFISHLRGIAKYPNWIYSPLVDSEGAPGGPTPTVTWQSHYFCLHKHITMN